MAERAYNLRLAAPVRRVVVVDPAAPASPPPAPPPPPEDRTKEVERALRADRQVIEKLRDQLFTAVADLRRREQERLAECRQAAVELAVAVATRLLHERITAGEFAVEALVRDMLGQLPARTPLAVALHPADLALLRQRLDGQPLLPDSAAEPRLVADPVLGRGNCRIETGEQTLYADLAEQLADIRAQLLGSLGHARP